MNRFAIFLAMLLLFASGRSATAQRVTVRDATQPTRSADRVLDAALASLPTFVVDESDIVWLDEERGRYVTARIFLPQTETEQIFPILLFSPDLGTAVDRYRELLQQWASRGYIVVAVSSPLEAVASPQTLNVEKRRSLRDYDDKPPAWRDRAADLPFALSQLRETETVAAIANFDIVALAGHGIGGHTVLACIGARMEGMDPLPIEADLTALLPQPRYRAAILLSPPGEDQFGLSRNSWSGIRTPTLTICGERGRGLLARNLRSCDDVFARAYGPDQFLLTMRRVRHNDFATGFGKTNGDTHRAQAITTTTALLFLRAVLDNDPTARQWLLDRRIERTPGYRCDLKYKNVVLHPQLLQPVANEQP